MLALLTASLSLTGGPTGALDMWRTSRLTQWSRVVDRRFDEEYHAFGKVRVDLRYRTQVLVVDGDGVRARLCEAVFDRLFENVDADVDSMASSMEVSRTSRRPTSALCDAVDSLGLSRLSLEAGARQLQPNDLLLSSRWDVVVCADLDVLERVRALARATNAQERTSGTVLGSDWGAEGRSDWEQWSSHPSGEGTDASVLCLTDFLASGLPPASAAKLPTQMQQLIAPPEQLGDTAVLVELIDRSIVDLPQLDAADEPVRAAVDDVVGAAAVCCAQLVAYLEALMREHATRAFERDLVTSCASAARAAGGYARDVTWEEAQAGMQREHDVDGGLSDEERRGLYDVYIEGLRSQSGGSVRVDVSDLGLTMDDLSGPFL